MDGSVGLARRAPSRGYSHWRYAASRASVVDLSGTTLLAGSARPGVGFLVRPHRRFGRRRHLRGCR